MNYFDENENHLKTSLFETYLSKFITENPKFYKPVFDKLNCAVEIFINHNITNRNFDRRLYSLFSVLADNYPGYTDFKKVKDQFNSQVNIDFYKAFFENIFSQGEIPSLESEKKIAMLSELVQVAIRKNTKLQDELKKSLRPVELFSDKARSRVERISPEGSPKLLTRKFGILSEEETPPDLQNYFEKPYVAGQFQFTRFHNGFFSKWLKQRELPFVAGPSGIIEILFRNLIMLDSFTPSELKAFFLGVSAAIVSRGHHSFAEILIITSKLGFKFNDLDNRQQFYEQFLTEDLLDSNEYKVFLSQRFVQEYFQEFLTSSSPKT